MVEVHVLQSLLRVPAAGPHLLTGDALQGHLVPVEADGGDVALVRELQVLVDPPVGGLAVRVHRDPVLAADVGEFTDPGGQRLGAAVAVLGRQPGVEEVGRLDHVVVDADDAGQFGRHGSPPPDGTYLMQRQIASHLTTRQPRSRGQT
jgi:hypothetical protein